MIGLLIAGLLILVAAGGSSSGGKALPAGVTETEKAVLCTLLKAAVPLENLPTLLARELFPAGSWPVSDVWTVEEVAALPDSLRDKYRQSQRLAELATTNVIVNECFEDLSVEPYANASISKTATGYRVKWLANKTAEQSVVSDAMPANAPMYARVDQTFDDFDAARAELYRGLLFWGFRGMGSGVPDAATFFAGNFFGENANRPGASIAGRRYSIWRLNPSLFYLVTTSDSGKFETTMHRTSSEAMAAAQNPELYR